jgi:Ca-activated chloride channel family protein
MSFDSPLFLLGLLLPPLLLWLRESWLKRESKRLRTFIRPVLWERVGIEPPPGRLLSRALWVGGFALAVIALAGPVWGTGEMTLPVGGENVVIALDVSASMGCTDETPSRLARASAAISSLVDELEDARVSLVLFASHARLAVPLTQDREFFRSRLPHGREDVLDLHPGTQIGGIIQVMESAAPGMALESRVGILFSDGGFHDHEIESSVEQARSVSMPVIAVGVGGDRPTVVPDSNGEPMLDAAGDTVRTAIEEELLIRLANETGGFYARLSTTEDLSGLVGEMLDRVRISQPELRSAVTEGRRYQIFLGAAMLCFLLAIVLETRRM